MYYSIWEDAIFTVTGMSSFNYDIYKDGETLIYSGKAYAKPNTGMIEINVSRIVQDYLDCNMVGDIATQTHPNALFNCELRDIKGSVLDTFHFIYCWDYKTRFEAFWDLNNYNLSVPINNHSASGMMRLSTKYNGSVSTSVGIDLDPAYCGEYAIYYLNAKGGWDSFLLEGYVRRTDNFTRYAIERGFMVDTLEFGHSNLTNTISIKWECNTHLMTDDESEKFAQHVLGTNSMYLHDLKDNTIYPVTVDDNSVEYKEFRKNGRKFAQYTFKITASQDRQRR